jgi:parvulin-like peptidyl-prolyl isomerase
MEHFKEFAQRSSFEQFGRQARGVLEQILMARISDILLYSQAKREAGQQVDERLDKLADAEVRRFIVSFDSDYAKAEEALKKMGMDWASFKKLQKKMILSQSYISSQVPENRPFTYSELMDNYNSMKGEFFTMPAMITIRLIDIEVAKVQLGEPNESRVERARGLANELVERIKNGEDFGELAKEYSHGHRRAFGGLWKPVQPGSLAAPYDVLAAEAERIEQGEIAGPIEAGGHIFIMKLEEKQPGSAEPFEKVQSRIEAKIVFERRKKAADEFTSKLIQQAKLANKDEFIEFCVEEIYRRCNR